MGYLYIMCLLLNLVQEAGGGGGGGLGSDDKQYIERKMFSEKKIEEK